MAPMHASVVDLWEFYAEVESLIEQLRTLEHAEAADEVEAAIRGGSTSGEILGRLRAALSDVSVQVPGVARRASRLTVWAAEALP
jgi:hypothetical protein